MLQHRVSLDEVIDAVHAQGALAGVHVCANTDWSLLLDSQVDIINFDAYGYFDKFVLYGDLLKQFIASGRYLAWGLVPTLLADQIEAQLGYRIVEMGDLIEVPEGARSGWDQDFDYYWRNDGNNEVLPREPGQLLAFYINDDNDSWGGEGSPMSAHICCGTTSYNRRFFRAPHWTQWTGANSPEGEAVVHELFHLLGFKHSFDQFDLIGVEMSRGGLDRPWVSGSPIYYATWTDIDNLRCIFPEGG